MNHTRRDFLRFVKNSTLACAISGIACQLRQSPSKPNIIFIMADDLGYADLGCYGQQHIQTPNIDNMALEGVRFTQCYTGSPVCAPSRSVLLTGQHAGHTRIRGNFSQAGGTEVTDDGPLQRRLPLEAEDITLGKVLKAAGYVTGITGKWGLGEPDTDGIPNKQGFDEWLGYLNQRRAHTYFPPYLWRNEAKILLAGNQNGKREEYSHDLFTDFALDFIQRQNQKPFFLFIPYCIPHDRYEIPDIEPYTDQNWLEEEKIYAAMITRMDRDVGKILQLLKSLKIDESTIVFFCSDNGAAQRWDGRFNSSGILRGRKRDLYEGGIRTPMIVRWPGHVPANKVSEQAWYFPDVLPTLAALAGTTPPSDIDGISVLPTILGQAQDTDDRFLYWEFHELGFQQAVRWQDWKAIRLAKNEPLELYNLKTDPGESINAALKNPELVQKIEAYLKTARTESKSWPT